MNFLAHKKLTCFMQFWKTSYRRKPAPLHIGAPLCTGAVSIWTPVFTGVTAFYLTLIPSLTWGSPAQLERLKGVVEIQTPVSPTWEIIDHSAPIDVGTRIRTNQRSRAVLTTLEGHKIAIGPNSFLNMQELGLGKTKFYLKEGVARSKVVKLRMDQGQYFKVQTPTAICAVRGTDFVTNVINERTEMKTIEGTVNFGSDELKAILVKEGFMGATDRDPGTQNIIPPDPPQPIPETTFTEQKNLDWNQPKQWDKQENNLFGSDFQEHPRDEGPREGPGEPGERREPKDKPKDGQGPNGPPPPNGTNPLNPPLGDPNQPPPPGSTNFGPPPAGNTTTNNVPFEDLVNQARIALDNEITTQKQQATINGTMIDELYRKGEVRFSPVDNQMHQFIDVVAAAKLPNTDPNNPNKYASLGYLNATMIPGKSDTLNYQLTTMDFNQPFNPGNPAVVPSLTLVKATAQNAFPSPNLSIPHTQYAIRVETKRSNGTDSMRMEYKNGASVNTGMQYEIQYALKKFEISGPRVAEYTGNSTLVVWDYGHTSTSNYTYFGGTSPSITTSGATNGIARSFVQNQFTPTNPNAPVLTIKRDVSYLRPTTNGMIYASSADHSASGQTALAYASGLYVHDIVTSNYFTKPIVSFGSVEARINAGVETLNNDAQANVIIQGGRPIGTPDGLLPSNVNNSL